MLIVIKVYNILMHLNFVQSCAFLFIGKHSGNFDLVQLDIDGAASKLMQFATNIISVNSYTPNLSKQIGPPDTYGLPSLRSAGFSISRADRAKKLVDRFGNVRTDNQDIEANPENPATILKAEDLVKGYRIDVWDSSSNRWHSLCFRDGTYHFLNSTLVPRIQDEGFISIPLQTHL
jgi:hypothetical protein